MKDLIEFLTNSIAVSYEEQKRYISTLSIEERSATGTVEGWSPKDTMAHILHWNMVRAATLERLDTGLSEDLNANYDRINAEIWEQYKDATWKDIQRQIEEVNTRLIESIRKLSDVDLTDPGRYGWMAGRPLWRSVLFTTYNHPLQHIAIQYAQRGGEIYANRLQEQAAENQMQVLDDDDWRGTVLYNLACHYALTNQIDLALEKLSLAFSLKPELRLWAPDDPDMANIKEDVRFLSMIDDDRPT